MTSYSISALFIEVANYNNILLMHWYESSTSAVYHEQANNYITKIMDIILPMYFVKLSFKPFLNLNHLNIRNNKSVPVFYRGYYNMGTSSGAYKYNYECASVLDCPIILTFSDGMFYLIYYVWFI